LVEIVSAQCWGHGNEKRKNCNGDGPINKAYNSYQDKPKEKSKAILHDFNQKNYSYYQPTPE
jgi:hypothetical protein